MGWAAAFLAAVGLSDHKTLRVARGAVDVGDQASTRGDRDSSRTISRHAEHKREQSARPLGQRERERDGMLQWTESEAITPAGNNYCYTTWFDVVQPGFTRACILCGQVCTSHKKTLLVDEIEELLALQTKLHDEVHCLINNMCMAAAEEHYIRNEPFDTVMCCASCYNWTRRRSSIWKQQHRVRGFGFCFPVQALRIHMHHLTRIDIKHFDSRMIKRLACSITSQHQGKTNIYYTLLDADERATMHKLAVCQDQNVRHIIAEHYRTINNNPLFVGSHELAVVLREQGRYRDAPR